jgi:plastocyanin domain-containing protein
MRKWTILAVAALLAGCAASGGRNDVAITVTDDGFEPETVTVARGQKATLVVTRTSETTCATEAVFAATGRKYDLPLRQAVRIPIATDKVDTLHYACGMDMVHGHVIVR